MGNTKLPVISGKRVVRVLSKAGFSVNRTVGSHHLMIYSGDPTRTLLFLSTADAI